MLDGVFSVAVMVMSEDGVGGESDTVCDGDMDELFEGENSRLNCIVEENGVAVCGAENDFDIDSSFVPRLGD